MVDITQFKDPAILAILIGLIVQFLKPILPTDKVPYFGAVIGILLALIVGGATGNLSDFSSFISYIVGGFVAALLAIGGYEITLDKFRSKQ